jgi:hypothetical protein
MSYKIVKSEVSFFVYLILTNLNQIAKAFNFEAAQQIEFYMYRRPFLCTFHIACMALGLNDFNAGKSITQAIGRGGP